MEKKSSIIKRYWLKIEDGNSIDEILKASGLVLFEDGSLYRRTPNKDLILLNAAQRNNVRQSILRRTEFTAEQLEAVFRPKALYPLPGANTANLNAADFRKAFDSLKRKNPEPKTFAYSFFNRKNGDSVQERSQNGVSFDEMLVHLEESRLDTATTRSNKRRR